MGREATGTGPRANTLYLTSILKFGGQTADVVLGQTCWSVVWPEDIFALLLGHLRHLFRKPDKTRQLEN